MLAVRLIEHPEKRGLGVRSARNTSVEATPPELWLPLRTTGSGSGRSSRARRRSRGSASRESASVSGRTSSRSSAELWYPGNLSAGERVSAPTGRSKPGEQNCRSSPPSGENGMSTPPAARTTFAAAWSISASPWRLRLYVIGAGSPRHESARPVPDAPDARLVLPQPARAARSCPGRRGTDTSSGGASRRDTSPSAAASTTPREVVVAERRVADVRGEEHLGIQLPRDERLGVGHMRHRRAIESITTSYSTFRQRVELSLAEAETPVLVVVRRAERDPVRILRVSVEVGAELVERHAVRGRARCTRARGGSSAGSRRRAAVRASATHASRMFHSRGSTQSKTCVPLAISVISSGTSRCEDREASRVRRLP